MDALESTCRPCKIETGKRWRLLHPFEVKLRNTWKGILERCSNPRHPKWWRYGGAGVRVCDRWASLAAFVEDVGMPPALDFTIDRIDGRGDYEPGNVRWATYAEQARNRAANRRIEFAGETLCLVDWGTRLGVSWTTLQSRLDRGWPVELALGPTEEDAPF